MSTEKNKVNRVNEVLQFPLADAFERDLTKALEESAETGAVVVAMVDLDNFMHINDTYGHEVGDMVLIGMGTHFKEQLQSCARLYRYSGDEFAVIFNAEVEKEEAFLRMEAVRVSYKAQPPHDATQTMTIGIAAAPDDGVRYAELVRKADGAMYRGKLNGRNRVCLAREEKMVTKTSHYTVEQLQRLTKLSKSEGIGEAILLREALDTLLKKYDI